MIDSLYSCTGELNVYGNLIKNILQSYLNVKDADKKYLEISTFMS